MFGKDGQWLKHCQLPAVLVKHAQILKLRVFFPPQFHTYHLIIISSWYHHLIMNHHTFLLELVYVVAGSGVRAWTTLSCLQHLRGRCKHLHSADTKCAILGRMALLALLVVNQRHTEMSQYHPRSIFFLAQDNFSPWCYQQPTYLCEQVPCHLWPQYTHTQKYQWQFVTSYDTLESLE